MDLTHKRTVQQKLIQYAQSTLKHGTLYTLSPEYRLVRGNPQRPGVLDLFSNSEQFDISLSLSYPAKSYLFYQCG
jgi:hypothetical protein